MLDCYNTIVLKCFSAGVLLYCSAILLQRLFCQRHTSAADSVIDTLFHKHMFILLAHREHSSFFRIPSKDLVKFDNSALRYEEAYQAVSTVTFRSESP